MSRETMPGNGYPAPERKKHYFPPLLLCLIPFFGFFGLLYMRQRSGRKIYTKFGRIYGALQVLLSVLYVAVYITLIQVLGSFSPVRSRYSGLGAGLLCPLVVALSASLTTATAGTLLSFTETETDLPAVPTVFNDSDLLVKTLTDHGLHVDRISENEFTVATEAGILRCFRENAGEAFRVEAKNVRDIAALISDLDELENEYGRNVQKFTYDHILSGLAEHGMSLDSEEILEDDSILLTLNVY